MSSVYAPVATTLPGGVTIPADGTDYVSASSVNVPLCAAFDGIAYNRGKVRKGYVGSIADTYATVLGTSTSTLRTQTDMWKILSIPAAVGETVNFRYHGHCLAPSFSLFSLALGPSRLPVANGAYTYVNGEVAFTVVGSTTIIAGHLNAGNLDIYMQGSRSTSGTLSAYTPYWLEVEIIKP